MTSNAVGRIGAWSAILSWPVLIAGFVTQSTLIIALAQFMTIPFFYALLVAHRARNRTMAAVVGYAAIAASAVMAVTSGDIEGAAWIAGSVVSGLAILAFSYLGVSSPVVPNVLAAIGVVFGATQLFSAFVPLPDDSIVPLFVLLSGIIWTVWLSVLLLRGRLVEA